MAQLALALARVINYALRLMLHTVPNFPVLNNIKLERLVKDKHSGPLVSYKENGVL